MLAFTCLLAVGQSLARKSVRFVDDSTDFDTSINGEELELSGNLSDFITEEHIAAREARVTFDQDRQVKFTVNTDYEGECPLSFLTFEANNNDNRDIDEFQDVCEKSLTTNEILIRFTSVDSFNTDQITYEIANSTDVEIADFIEGSTETAEYTVFAETLDEDILTESETIEVELETDSSKFGSREEETEDSDGYDVIQEELEMITAEDTVRNILMSATYLSLFFCSLALSGLVLLKWKRTVLARLWIKDLRRVIDGNKGSKEKEFKANRFCNDDVIITANTEVFRTA